MAIDKALTRAPVGIEQMAQEMGDAPEIEVEIVDPEAVNVSVDGEEILSIEPGEAEEDFYANLAEEMDLSELEGLGFELLEDIKGDLDSRKEWEDTYKQGLTLLGLQYEERTEPWNGACGVFHPMITEAVVRFQSETIMETFAAQGPVQTTIIGK